MLAAALVFAFVASARAADLAGPQPLANPSVMTSVGRPEPPPERRTLARLPANLVRGVVGVVHVDNLKAAIVGGGAAAVASIWDTDLRESAAHPDSGFGSVLETTGAWPAGVLVGGLYAVGRLAHAPRLRAMGYDMIDASIVGFGYASLLKVAVRRERPDGSGKASFPSAHTSNAFALATVAEQHYGWAVGVPAYAFAATIGASRIVRDRHYLSDVVAGATLGVIVGRTVVRVNGRPPGRSTKTPVLGVSPVIGPRERSVVVALSF